MQKKPYDTLVFIGRFQPFHNGHFKVIQRAFELANQVIVLIGSTNQSRSLRNPFTYDEREDVIYSALGHNPGLDVFPIKDIYNDTLWVEQVQAIVAKTAWVKPGKIGLIGHSRDHTSYYLKMFPTWGSVEVNDVDGINATEIRSRYFTHGLLTDLDSCPAATKTFLQDFRKTDTYADLVEETLFIQEYKKTVTKYPRIEHTVDAVVIQSGHVLLITRGARPGEGLLALPGGFVNPDETLLDAALRELKEETGLKVPVPVLKGNIVTNKTYDNPNRSARGRIITTVFLIKLPDQIELPKIHAGSDASKARWEPLALIDGTKLFEDHGNIIADMVSYL